VSSRIRTQKPTDQMMREMTLAFRLRIPKVQGSNVGLETGCCNRDGDSTLQ